MTKQINLNVAAIALLAGNPNVRVRATDGVLQFRPTARKDGAKLPEGETLHVVKSNGPTYSSVIIPASFDATVQDGTNYSLTLGKHGWLSFGAVEGKPEAGAANATVKTTETEAVLVTVAKPEKAPRVKKEKPLGKRAQAKLDAAAAAEAAAAAAPAETAAVEGGEATAG